jgi:hypothetical protein
MKKLSILTCTMIALGFMATTVRADSAHYIKGPTASLSGNDYCVSFKEAGLGSTPVTYTITSDATFTWQCFTRSNNTPQGSPNSVSFPHDTNTITVQPHNGQITGELCLTPEGSGNCQGHGLVSRLIGVCYTNVTFTDSATGQTFTLDDMSSGTGCP